MSDLKRWNSKNWLSYINAKRSELNLNVLNKSQCYEYILAWLIHNELFDRESKWINAILSSEPTVLNYYVNSSTIERPYKPGQILLMVEFEETIHSTNKVPYYIRYDCIDSVSKDESFNSVIGIKKQMINMYFPFNLFFSIPYELDYKNIITEKLRNIPSLKGFRYVLMNRTTLVYCIIQFKCTNYDIYKKKMKLLKLKPICISSCLILPYYDNHYDDNDNSYLYSVSS